MIDMRLRTRLHERFANEVCALSGTHHVEFVLQPGWRRYVQRCKRCGRVWTVEPTRVP